MQITFVPLVSPRSPRTTVKPSINEKVDKMAGVIIIIIIIRQFIRRRNMSVKSLQGYTSHYVYFFISLMLGLKLNFNGEALFFSLLFVTFFLSVTILPSYGQKEAHVWWFQVCLNCPKLGVAGFYYGLFLIGRWSLAARSKHHGRRGESCNRLPVVGNQWLP